MQGGYMSLLWKMLCSLSGYFLRQIHYYQKTMSKASITPDKTGKEKPAELVI